MGVTSEVKGRLTRSGWFGEDEQWLHYKLFLYLYCRQYWRTVITEPFLQPTKKWRCKANEMLRLAGKAIGNKQSC